MVNTQELEESIATLTLAKLRAKATGNPYVVAHLLSHLGHLQAAQRQFEQARETLNEADFVLIDAAQKDRGESLERHRAWIRYSIERARFFAITGWDASALDQAEHARDMAHSTAQVDLLKEAVNLLKTLPSE